MRGGHDIRPSERIVVAAVMGGADPVVTNW